jgi:hypothetical protein
MRCLHPAVAEAEVEAAVAAPVAALLRKVSNSAVAQPLSEEQT